MTVPEVNELEVKIEDIYGLDHPLLSFKPKNRLNKPM